MAEPKKGLWSRLFGGQGCCCNIRIEEVDDDNQAQAKAPVASPCCGPADTGAGKGRRSDESK
ncbi:MAG: hypothetical protein ACPLRW_09475 [Moorellales bacterium]